MENQTGRKELPEQVTQVISIAEALLKSQILGIYLYGSATMNGLRPGSDIDILIIIEQEMSNSIRDDLTKQLLSISGSVGCIEKRPLEITIINRNDIIPLRFPPKCEYMYGEWLREDMEAGRSPQSCYDPDIMILLWQARKNSKTLKGMECKKLIPFIPFREIKKAIQFSLPSLVSNFKGDERNVLLTLSRMWFTLETQETAIKNIAAEWVISILPEKFSLLITTAKEAYLGNQSDEWGTIENETTALIEFMKEQIEELLKID
ncbi:MAG: aminoglycoside nucleotidyltransferase ANT(9) [Cloacibacillus porcorum]|uniref:aminoglycoside nucleotidyltransferase ANT(9) n=1 Tax=Cloacibacillus porcorum TaxID=1197717 RepID=UPI0023F215DC|nr:aminoglycoside nucleotidyltransferase ANT(9) [Cloacibacillus porcorum]MCD7875501.1 aminoglycoside nucleotidyltransferase ANT(9) [Cloacibacillus porcorum]